MELEFKLDNILESLLSSDIEEIIEALKILEKHGDDSCISKIEVLNNHNEVSVRYHSKRALNLISRRIGIKPKQISTKKKIVNIPDSVDMLNIPEPIFDDTDSFDKKSIILENYSSEILDGKYELIIE